MPLSVYYLDDEETLCEIFADYFASTEIKITVFSDPTKAINASKGNPPDVLFVDFRLPGTTGDKVAMAMAPEIPKYLLTGDITVNTSYEFKSIFQKPCKPESIQEVLSGLLKIKKAA